MNSFCVIKGFWTPVCGQLFYTKEQWFFKKKNMKRIRIISIDRIRFFFIESFFHFLFVLWCVFMKSFLFVSFMNYRRKYWSDLNVLSSLNKFLPPVLPDFIPSLQLMFLAIKNNKRPQSSICILLFPSTRLLFTKNK